MYSILLNNLRQIAAIECDCGNADLVAAQFHADDCRFKPLSERGFELAQQTNEEVHDDHEEAKPEQHKEPTGSKRKRKGPDPSQGRFPFD